MVVASEPTVTCLNCLQVFTSNSKLHEHLQDCKPQAAADISTNVVANFAESMPIFNSAVQPSHMPGYAFRSWRYATATIGLTSLDKITTYCLDSGCVMTLIDSKLATSLPCSRHQITPPIPVNGIGSQHLSSEYVVIDMFCVGQVNGQRAAARIQFEAHVVEDLRAKLLIGMDVMGPEGVVLDFPRSRAIVESCDGLTFPIALYAKPNHVDTRPVYALSKVEIPPRQRARVPVQVKTALPNDRDFIFEPLLPRSKLVVPSQVVDAQFSYVDAVNETDKVQVIRKRDRIGKVLEADYTSAYQVTSGATELATQATQHSPHESTSLKVHQALSLRSMESVSPTTTEYSKQPNLETVLPNGIIIYGTPEVADTLRQVCEAYDIWSDPRVVNIPQDRWMRLPVIPDSKPQRC